MDPEHTNHKIEEIYSQYASSEENYTQIITTLINELPHQQPLDSVGLKYLSNSIQEIYDSTPNLLNNSSWNVTSPYDRSDSLSSNPRFAARGEHGLNRDFAEGMRMVKEYMESIELEEIFNFITNEFGEHYEIEDIAKAVCYRIMFAGKEPHEISIGYEPVAQAIDEFVDYFYSRKSTKLMSSLQKSQVNLLASDLENYNNHPFGIPQTTALHALHEIIAKHPAQGEDMDQALKRRVPLISETGRMRIGIDSGDNTGARCLANSQQIMLFIQELAVIHDLVMPFVIVNLERDD